MKNIRDITKIQDKMLDLSIEIRGLKYITKSLNNMFIYDFSIDEIICLSEIINEKATRIHEKYSEIECELNI
ncbi:hypothetical protein IJ707_04465 [bacterium]|nr:hypothetical protein [bacterium]